MKVGPDHLCTVTLTQLIIHKRVTPSPVGYNNKVTYQQRKHHEVHIPSAEVYIKYDATEFPGINLSVYDNQTTASDDGGHFEFEGMEKGNYYLYAKGYDISISEEVSGGTPVEIKSKKQEVEMNVPVTE